MLTFTEMKEQAAANCGLYPDSPEMRKVSRDINTGAKLFHNAARRYFTKENGTLDLKANISSYLLPSYVLRISSLVAAGHNAQPPMVEIQSEEDWHSLVAASMGMSASRPTHYFISGNNRIEVYPTPTEDVVGGIDMTYEPKIADMSIKDICMEATLERGSTTVTGAWPDDFDPVLQNSCYLTVGDGLDGLWYKVESVEGDVLTLEVPYQGQSSDEAEIRIGQCPPFPDEYHDAPVYFACKQFFLLRKDLESASMYGQMFDELFAKYRTAYGNKTTGGVINPRKRQQAGRINSWPGVLGA